MDSHDHAREIAGDHSEWWGFDVPEFIPDGDEDIWWCKHCSQNPQDDFIHQANAHAWREIGHEIHMHCIDKGRPMETYMSSGCLWVKIFTDDSKEEMTPGAHKIVDALCALADYACLDDTLAGRLLYDAQLESICEFWPSSIDDDALPDEKEEHGNAKVIWTWLWGNKQDALEHEAGYVSPEGIKDACWHLGWLEPEDNDDFIAMMTRFKKKGGARESDPER